MATVGKNGETLPQMWRHSWTLKKDIQKAKTGETVSCFVAEMLDGRYMVWDSHWSFDIRFYKVFTVEEMNDTFDEVNV